MYQPVKYSSTNLESILKKMIKLEQTLTMWTKKKNKYIIINTSINYNTNTDKWEGVIEVEDAKEDY